MRLKLFLLVALGVAAAVALLGCGRRLSSRQAATLLRQVQEARRNTVLQGRLETSVRVRGQMVSSEVSVRRGPGVAQLEYLSGRFNGWRIVDQNGRIWRIDPHGKPMPPMGGGGHGHIGIPHLAGHTSLQISYLGRGQVAGRAVKRYLVRPSSDGGVRLMLSLDRQTNYPLRMDRYNSDGHLVSSSVFQTIDYQAKPPQPLLVPAVAATHDSRHHPSSLRVATEADLEKLLGGSPLKPTYLPQGFALRGMFIRQTRHGQGAELRYSDGLRSLTVLQFRSAGQSGAWQRPEGAGEHSSSGPRLHAHGHTWWRHSTTGKTSVNSRPRRGEHNGPAARAMRSPWRGHIVRERHGDRVVVVAGDLNTQELKRVADSIPMPPATTPNTNTNF